MMTAETKRNGRFQRTGTIYLDRSFRYYRRGAGRCQRNEWRAEISVHGHKFRCRAGSYAACERWCEDMVEKYGDGFRFGPGEAGTKELAGLFGITREAVHHARTGWLAPAYKGMEDGNAVFDRAEAIRCRKRMKMKFNEARP